MLVVYQFSRDLPEVRPRNLMIWNDFRHIEQISTHLMSGADGSPRGLFCRDWLRKKVRKHVVLIIIMIELSVVPYRRTRFALLDDDDRPTNQQNSGECLAAAMMTTSGGCWALEGEQSEKMAAIFHSLPIRDRLEFRPPSPLPLPLPPSPPPPPLPRACVVGQRFKLDEI